MPRILRCFFGLVKQHGNFYLRTLDTLVRYAGPATFADFGQSVAGHVAAADISKLLAMERLAPPECLLLGYFLGRVMRTPCQPGPAGACPHAARTS